MYSYEQGNVAAAVVVVVVVSISLFLSSSLPRRNAIFFAIHYSFLNETPLS